MCICVYLWLKIFFMKRTPAISLLIFALFLTTCENSPDANQIVPTAGNSQPPPNVSAKKAPAEFFGAMKAVAPFFKPMSGEPKPDEWLANNVENGQTFAEYLKDDPTLPTGERRTIYVQPLGKFNDSERNVINAAAEFLEKFYNLPVKVLPDKKYAEPLPPKNFRVHPQWKTRQINAGYVLNEVLLPTLPTDAAALIAFTDRDLYPSADMNFVFGQASLENRVGVWSLYRLDNLTDAENFLKRTLKIAAHETGHIFSMRHCTKYECVMSGTNHLGETDSRPLDACPECMAKICWLSDCNARQRYQNLADFCRKHDLKKEEAEFRKKAAAVN